MWSRLQPLEMLHPARTCIAVHAARSQHQQRETDEERDVGNIEDHLRGSEVDGQEVDDVSDTDPVDEVAGRPRQGQCNALG